MFRLNWAKRDFSWDLEVQTEAAVISFLTRGRSGQLLLLHTLASPLGDCGSHPGLHCSIMSCFFLHFLWLLSQVCAKLCDKGGQLPLQDSLHRGWRWWVTDMASCPSLWVSAQAHGFYLILTLPKFISVFPSLAQFSARASCYIQIGSLLLLLLLLLLAVLGLYCSIGPSSVEARGLSCHLACAIIVPQPGIEPMSLVLEGRFFFSFFFFLEGRFLTTGPPRKSQTDRF